MDSPEMGSPRPKKTPEQLREAAQPLWTEQVIPVRSRIQQLLSEEDPERKNALNTKVEQLVRTAYVARPDLPLRENIDNEQLRLTLCKELLQIMPEEVPNNVFLRQSRKGPILVRSSIFASPPMPFELAVAFERLGFPEGQNRTLEDVGGQFGITRERVRQITSDVQASLTLNRAIRSVVLSPQE